MIVVDASAVLELLLNTVVGARLAVRLHAPHLLDLEVAQLLRRWARSGQVDSRRGAEAAATRVERGPRTW